MFVNVDIEKFQAYLAGFEHACHKFDVKAYAWENSDITSDEYMHSFYLYLEKKYSVTKSINWDGILTEECFGDKVKAFQLFVEEIEYFEKNIISRNK